jgi:pimeloyl-ACP methyl ester carboxylesterase
MNPRAILPVLLLGLLAGCQGPDTETDSQVPAEEQEFEREHAAYDFPAMIDGQEFIQTYAGTHDIMADGDPEVRQVVFVQHGAAQNPVRYFQDAVTALEEADSERPELGLDRHVVILSIAAIGESHVEDNPDRYADGHYAYWPSGWRGGEASLNDPSISNFDLLDAMATYVADHFPALESIVFVGHSAGGQVMSRYAVGTPLTEGLEDRGIRVRYIISNPSTFLYFDRQRPDFEAGEGMLDFADQDPLVDDEACPAFNEYHTGFEGERPEYMTRRSVDEMLETFRHREVYLLQGADDNDPEGAALARGCDAMLQGAHRLERGERFYEYLGTFFGEEVYDNMRLVVVPGVGHNHAGMFASESGKQILFFDFFGDQAAEAPLERGAYAAR